MNELKSRAYDLIVLISQAQNELNQINSELAKLAKEEPKSVDELKKEDVGKVKE